MSLKTWVLVDNRLGNSNQARALGKLLKLNYQEKFIEYNKFASIPYLIPGLRILKKSTRDALVSEKADLIISSGRRASKVALALKKLNPAVKIIQILSPESKLNNFDLVILPEHDKKAQQTYPKNVLFSYGAISYFSDLELAAETTKWEAKFNQYQRPFIAILLGGNSKKCTFKNTHISELTDIISKLASNKKCTLFITSSRRTPQQLVNLLKTRIKELNLNNLFYDPQSGGDNPYKAFLAVSDYIITTGDSISMCSEASFMNKPVFIYVEKDMVSDKHYKFVQSLFSNGIAKDLKEGLRDYQPKAKELNQQLISKIKNLLAI